MGCITFIQGRRLPVSELTRFPSQSLRYDKSRHWRLASKSPCSSSGLNENNNLNEGGSSSSAQSQHPEVNRYMCGSCHNRSVLIGIEYRNCSVSNFGCLVTFCYSARTDLSKKRLQTSNLQTGQSISYKYVNCD